MYLSRQGLPKEVRSLVLSIIYIKYYVYVGSFDSPT